MDTHQSYPTWFQADLSAELSAIPPKGCMPNQHPRPAFHAIPAATRPNSTRVRRRGLSHVHPQPLAGRVYLNPGIVEDSSSLPMVVNFHPGAYPIDCLPRGGERHMFPSDHNTPAHTSGIPSRFPVSADLLMEQTRSQYYFTNSSQGVHTWQSNCPAATLPRRSPLQFGFPILASAAMSPTRPVVPERAFLPTPSSPHDRGPKETPFATYACPFPTCQRRFGRTQDLERHIHRHISRCICCTECNWTGSRRCALRDHYKKKHEGVPIPGQEIYMIYDAKVLVKRLLKKEITLEQAVRSAHLLFQSKAVEVGKLDIWRE